MKKMRKGTTVFLFSLLAAVMGACNLVPNFNPDEPTLTSKVVGTWYASLKNSNVCPSNEMEVTVYNADNTGKWCFVENGVWVEKGFTYETGNHQVTLTFADGTTRQMTVSVISANTMMCKDVEANVTWNLLKASHNYVMQLLGTWKRTTEPLNEPNTMNDVYTLNADGTYQVVRAASGETQQGTWKAYGCVLCLSAEPFLTRTMTSATGYTMDMAWQTVTDDFQPSACAMQRMR